MADGMVVMRCIECNTECKRTGQSQKRCVNCAASRKKNLTKQWQDKHVDSVKAKKQERYRELAKSRPLKGNYGFANCKLCGKAFAKRSPASLLCGEECRNKNRRIWKQARVKGFREFKPRNCIDCNALVVDKKSRRIRCENCHAIKRAKTWKACSIRKLKLRNESPRMRMEHSIRTNVRNEFKRRYVTKNKRSLQYLGVTAKELMAYLLSHPSCESHFTEDNYGSVWHVDHVRPLASFSDEELDVAWLYTNLQPMEAKKNLSKGSLWCGKRHHRILDTVKNSC